MKKYVYFKSGETSIKVFVDDILYVKGERKYVKVVTTSKAILIRDSITHIYENILITPHFCRIHKSYIVSLSQISRFDAKSVVVQDRKLPVGRKFKNSLNAALQIHPEIFSVGTPQLTKDFLKELSRLYYSLLQFFLFDISGISIS